VNAFLHTPGPLVASKGWDVATIENGQPGDTCETEGYTAKLFAAGPELLAACELTVQRLDSDGANSGSTLVIACRAAIAKAKGEEAKK